MSTAPGIRGATPGDDVLPVIRAAFADEREQVSRIWSGIMSSEAVRASIVAEQEGEIVRHVGLSHGFVPASARTPDAALQVVRFDGHEEWMTGQVTYRDAWWRHDGAGLRDPLLAQIEEGTR